MAHFEETLDSKKIYEGKIITIRCDTVRLENGNSAVREVVEHPGGVCILAIDDNDEIFMVRQFRYPMKKELWELPAGKLERGEDPAACGVRELEEECGCKAGVFEPLTVLYPTCAYDEELIHIYYAKNLTSCAQNLDDDEFLTVKKIPLNEAVEMVLDGKIPDAKTQIGILQYQALRNAGRI